MILSVYEIKDVISEARIIPSSKIPPTRGEEFLQAINLSFSLLQIIPKA